MHSSLAEQQAANVVPPRRGSIVALGIDATARPYDLTALAFGGDSYNEKTQTHVFLTLQNEGTDPVYYALLSATANDLDDTAKIAAGGTLAFANPHAAVIQGGQMHRVRIQKDVDKFLEVKCAATKTSTLRIYASSSPTPRPQ